MGDCLMVRDKLAEICERKRSDIAALEAGLPYGVVREKAESSLLPRGFLAALRERCELGERALICEIKKASPSRGLIRADFDVAVLARAYRNGGASCLSVLTDEAYFQGDYSHLGLARAAVPLAVLQKDFILNEWQIYHARVMGADCILLIMAALDLAEAFALQALAHALGMDVLLEAHDEAELEMALKVADNAPDNSLGNSLIGINNRNLKTLQVDLSVGETLLPQIRVAGGFAVAESGLSKSEDLARLEAAGANAFLVGESLLRQPDITTATTTLLNK